MPRRLLAAWKRGMKSWGAARRRRRRRSWLGARRSRGARPAGCTPRAGGSAWDAAGAPAVLAAAERTLRPMIGRQLAAPAAAGARQVQLLVPVFNAVPPARPPELPRKSIDVPLLADGAITIDGDLSDWKGRAVLELEP